MSTILEPTIIIFNIPSLTSEGCCTDFMPKLCRRIRAWFFLTSQRLLSRSFSPLLLRSLQPSVIGGPKTLGSPCGAKSQIMQRLSPSGLNIVTTGFLLPKSAARWMRNQAAAIPFGEAKSALPSWLLKSNVKRLAQGTTIVFSASVEDLVHEGFGNCLEGGSKLALFHEAMDALWKACWKASLPLQLRL